MNTSNKFHQSKLVAVFISLLSVLLLAITPFERNPNQCNIIGITEKKKKNTHTDDEKCN